MAALLPSFVPLLLCSAAYYAAFRYTAVSAGPVGLAEQGLFEDPFTSGIKNRKNGSNCLPTELMDLP
jgi:hypothetical protein